MTAPCVEIPPVDSTASASTPLPLRELARRDLAGRRGGAAHVSKYVRLIKRGAALQDGTRIYPEAIRDSGGWMMSLRALAEFRERLTADRLRRDPGATPAPAKSATPSPAPVRRSARQRDESSRRAGAALAAAGW